MIVYCNRFLRLAWKCCGKQGEIEEIYKMFYTLSAHGIFIKYSGNPMAIQKEMVANIISVFLIPEISVADLMTISLIHRFLYSETLHC